jgi:hypothetical protein
MKRNLLVSLVLSVAGLLFLSSFTFAQDVGSVVNANNQFTLQTTVSSNTKNLCKTDKEFIDSVQSDSECVGQDFRCVDGWSSKVYYDKRLTTIIPENGSSLLIPEELKKAIIAKYGKSSCSCKTPISYQILSEGQLKETDCESFYNFIENYNSSCDNCILTWETDCC